MSISSALYDNCDQFKTFLTFSQVLSQMPFPSPVRGPYTSPPTRRFYLKKSSIRDLPDDTRTTRKRYTVLRTAPRDATRKKTQENMETKIEWWPSDNSLLTELGRAARKNICLSHGHEVWTMSQILSRPTKGTYYV